MGGRYHTDDRSDTFLERLLELRPETDSDERPLTAFSKTTKTLAPVNSHAKELGSHITRCVENYMNVYTFNVIESSLYILS